MKRGSELGGKFIAMRRYDRGTTFKVVSAATGILVAVLIVIAIWATATETAKDGYLAEANRAHYANGIQDRVKTDCVGQRQDTAAFAECVEKVISDANEERRGESDLEAQRGMERWAFWMLVVSSIGVGVTAVGTTYVAMTLSEARRTTIAAIKGADAAEASVAEARKATKFAEKAANVAKESLVATDRAWIEVACEPISDLFFGEDDIRLEVRVTYRNVGKSPAVNLRVSECRLLQDLTMASTRVEEITAKSMFNYSLMTVLNWGSAIFPGQEISREVSLTMPRNDFINRIKEINEEDISQATPREDTPVPIDELTPAVMVGISYFLAGDRAMRHTYVTFDVRMQGSDWVGFNAEPKTVLNSNLYFLFSPAGNRIT